MRRSSIQKNARTTEKNSRRRFVDVEKVRTFTTTIGGGVDEITGLLQFEPDDALFSRNYIPVEGGGFQLSAQLERFDGTSPAPRDASYYALPYEMVENVNFFTAGAYSVGGTSGATSYYRHLNAISFKNGTEKFIPGTVISITIDTYAPLGPVYGTSTLDLNCRGVSLLSGSWEGGDAAGIIYTDSYGGSPTAMRALDGYRITGANGARGEAELAYSASTPARFVPPVIISNCASSTDIANNTPPVSNVYKIPFNNGSSNENPSDDDLSYPEWFRPPCMIKTDQQHYFWLTEVEITSGDPTTDDAAGFLYGVPMIGNGVSLASASYFAGGGAVYIGGGLCGGYAQINGALASTGDFTSLEDADNDAVWKAKGIWPSFSWDGTAYTDGEDLEDVTATKFGEVRSGESQKGEGALSDDAVHRAYTNFAGILSRFFIKPVPGTGPVRGIFEYEGDVFAVREAETGSRLAFHFASGVPWAGTGSAPTSSSQWDEISGYIQVYYDAGAFDINDPADAAYIGPGTTITGLTSGASGVVVYVGTNGGSESGGDMTGWMHFDSTTGGLFQDNEALQVGGVTRATANGDAAATEFSATATPEPCEAIKANFGDGEKVYMTTGTSDIAVYDGNKMARIRLGTISQLGGKPDHIIEHKGYLFCSIESSVYVSGIGNPFSWSALDGAAEISLANRCTGFSITSGGLLAIFQRDKVGILYGTTTADFELKYQPSRIGAVEYSMQPDVNPIFTDVQGITTLSAVQEFGDFRATELSKKINRTLRQKINNIATSVKIKDAEQYWLFFSDGTGIAGYFGGDTPEFGSFSYQSEYTSYDILPFVAFSTDYVNGQERVFMGDQEGYVYEMNVGTSLDGAPLEAYARLAPWNMKAPNINKHFLKATLYVEAAQGSEVQVTYELDYGDWSLERGEDTAFSIDSLNDIDASGGYWGVSEWGSFTWGGRAVSEINLYVDSPGRNLGLVVHSLSTEEPVHTIEGCVVEYTMRGRKS